MFNPDVYDFRPIFDTIKKYYLIGIDKDFPNYAASPGFQELVKLLEKNIHDDENYKARWENFCIQVEKATSAKVISTTYCQQPGFSAYLLIEETKMNNLTRSKELHFFIGLLGPYFSIIGKDSSSIEFEKDHYYTVTNYLTVSPDKEYTEIFKTVEAMIQDRFKDYWLIPFELLKQKIGDGFFTPWNQDREMTVFNALFNNQVETETKYISGDQYYGREKWFRKDFDPSQLGGWTVYPRGENF